MEINNESNFKTDEKRKFQDAGQEESVEKRQAIGIDSILYDWANNTARNYDAN